jgi:hypothetical protein
MKKTFLTTAAVMLILLASTSMVFASNGGGNGPDYDSCPKDSMAPEDVARFEEIIEEYQAKMAELRGNPDAFDERLQLKEAKRAALLEIVPAEFADRFGSFSTEKQGMRNGGVAKGSGNGSVN